MNATVIASGAFHTCARLTDGTIWCWGDNHRGQVGNGMFQPLSKPTSVVLD
ncbi:MAG: hypothetical protein KC502_18825 [Myxococcales bacterium]|nr:hypothetical protein [Myxococcales bacterium]